VVPGVGADAVVESIQCVSHDEMARLVELGPYIGVERQLIVVRKGGSLFIHHVHVLVVGLLAERVTFLLEILTQTLGFAEGMNQLSGGLDWQLENSFQETTFNGV